MGKGGSTQSVQVPQWLEDAARRNLGIADQVARVGPVPLSYGPTVADFTDAQRAAFNNTNAMAAAYGMDAPGQYNVGSPVTYPNGVRALSAAPLFEAQMAAFRDARPGQANYIDGFFIDPITGAPAGNVAVQYGSGSFGNPGGVGGAQNASADGGSDGATFAPVDTGPGNANSNFTTYGGDRDIAHQNVDNAFSSFTPNGNNNDDSPSYNAGLAAANSSGGYNSAAFNKPGLSMADQYSMMGSSMASAGIKNLGGGYNQNDPTTGIGGVLTDAGGAIREDLARSPTVVGKLVPNAPDSTYDSDGDPSTDNNKSDCVIATHAVAAGAYNHQTKRQAVVWCMNALHGKWWGEAVRRGYRHLGRRKIEQGKAAEHYDEFRRYIDFASGKNRTLRGAITFTLRTAQFFVVGMMNQEA